MKWYGVMCCEMDGSLENLECEADYKPTHETSGFFFAKWFNKPEDRDKTKEYLRKVIEERRLK
jgi:hypothetical protein